MLAMALMLISPSFTNHAEIPARHTCEGADVSPSLTWSGVPERARSLALIVDDPDAPDPAAPRRTWVHWVVYDLPATASGLREGARPADQWPGAHEGKNDWNRTAWGGPCPPIGRHRYFFKLYALDTVIPDQGALTKAELEKAMTGHVIEETELMGTYQKR